MNPEDINTLRTRLRALGYLDAPVDRFVLGSTQRHTAALAWRASLRIGVLAGVLLGPAAVVGLVMRAPDLVTRPLDAAVLTLYLMVPFAIAAAALSGVAVTLGLWIARQDGSPLRVTRTAMGTGLAAAAACLVYLTFWWQTAVPTGHVQGHLVALAVAAAIALLLGHGVTIVVLATLVGRGMTNIRPGTPLSSWRVLAPLGVLAVSAGWFLLQTWTPATDEVETPPAVTVVPTGVRVTVVGLDGADPDTLDRLIAAGDLPTLAGWLSGARASLGVASDVDPARAWTTMATGQPAARHGIRSLEGRQLAGVEGRVDASRPSLLTTATDLLRLSRPTIASGDQRRVPAFWDVANAAGLRSAVVHWWATWPATDTDGIVVSDRALLRLEQGGELAGEIAPATLYATLRSSADRRDARVQQWVSRLGSSTSASVRDIIDRSARLDAAVLALATDEVLGALDLRAVYLPGLDIAQHALFPTSGTTIDPAQAAERVRAIDAYYRFLDQMLGEALPQDLAGTTMVVTHPGRTGMGRESMLAISAGVGSAGVRTHAAPEAVAPTVLRLLGVPVAADLAASSADLLLAPAFTATYTARAVSTYGERRQRPEAGAGATLDKEMIERMRSLGYVR